MARFFNAVRSASRVSQSWLAAHARVVRGKTVLKVNGQRHTLPRAKLTQLERGLR